MMRKCVFQAIHTFTEVGERLPRPRLAWCASQGLTAISGPLQSCEILETWDIVN